MRSARRAAAALGLAVAFLAGAAVPAAADGEDGDLKEAGTTFRSATVIEQGVEAEAVGAVGDYLYWAFAAAAGEVPTVTATVTLPKSAAGAGNTAWQVDVHDGLRRHQPCAAGAPRRVTRPQTETVTLTCTLRAVQPWAEQWSDSPLPGAYFLRLTAVSLPDEALGLPLRVRVGVSAEGAEGARRGGGSLPAPLLPAVQAGSPADGGGNGGGQDSTGQDEDGEDGSGSAPRALAVAEPESGWNGPWFADRWLWTAAGGVLAAVAGVGGYLLVRRPRF
ncbi:hypothetical protein QNO07_12200 [Streptomyces sp. 549]|uniref:hypothetical protein n=1 Tax=Streptomyces sp. 549 TaxID=3049076 RepID=UPI0024C2D32D|nr:hypothetical protein [Streptomyces sp. 549]MDK1474168.1 hypothetical protein [Streptomyces sp. 549]